MVGCKELLMLGILVVWTVGLPVLGAELGLPLLPTPVGDAVAGTDTGKAVVGLLVECSVGAAGIVAGVEVGFGVLKLLDGPVVGSVALLGLGFGGRVMTGLTLELPLGSSVGSVVSGSALGCAVGIGVGTKNGARLGLTAVGGTDLLLHKQLTM